MNLLTLQQQYQQHNDHSLISSGCTQIDQYIQGGFIRDSIVELYGQAGTSKTSLACQIALHSLLNDNQSRSIYISTLKQLSDKRKDQILESMLLDQQQIEQIDNRLIQVHLNEQHQFNEFMFGNTDNSLQFTLSNYKVNVIIIDTLSQMHDQFIEYNKEQKYKIIEDKKQFIIQIAGRLKQIATQYNLVIININNVTADVDNNRQKPMMGNLWTQMINERMELTKTSTFQGIVRTINVSKSIRINQNTSFNIQADQSGVKIK